MQIGPLRITKRVAIASLKASFPVLLGYMTMGFAGGILLAKSTGLSSFWALLTAISLVSGTLQFLLVDFFQQQTGLATIALLALGVNLRYALYGLPFLNRWKKIPILLKLYLILTLTDENFALEVENRHPAGEDSLTYCTLLSLFDHFYWILGVTTGNLAGHWIPFNARGIDFSMTALFLVILLDQLRDAGNRMPAAIGICAALAGFWLSPKNMLIPAIALLLICLFLFRPQIQATQPKSTGELSHEN